MARIDEIAKVTEAHTAVHNRLHETVASHHQQLHTITQVEEECALKRGLIVATAQAELEAAADELSVSHRVVGAVTAACW